MLVWRAVQSIEQLLGAVEQAGAMEILRELVSRRRPLVGGQIGAIEQVLVHPDRAVDFPLPAKQRTQCEVQVDCLRVDFDDFDE